MRDAGIILCIGIALIGCGIQAHRVSLDASKVDVKSEPGHAVEFGVSGFPPPPSGEFPLRLELLRLDHPQYRRLNCIKYDVSIKNLSRDPVLFPWSPAPINRRDRPASGYRHALFELLLVRTNQKDWSSDTFVLYGAPTVPGSLKELKPDESVTIRLSAALSGNGPQDLSNPILHPAAGLRAKVGLCIYSPDDERFRFFHEEFSTDTLPIKVLLPGRPQVGK
jgi:hypothetical protein